MWVKRVTVAFFFGPLWVLYPVWPTPIYSHLLKWLSPISVDIRSASATNRECCGWVVLQRLEPVKSGVFWPTWSSTVFLGFLGSKPINLEWTHQSKSILHWLPTLSPDHPKSETERCACVARLSFLSTKGPGPWSFILGGYPGATSHVILWSPFSTRIKVWNLLLFSLAADKW